MAVSQVAVAASLILLSQVSAHQTGWIACLLRDCILISDPRHCGGCLSVEAADNENQAAMSAMYILGYRVALLTSGRARC